MRILQFEDRCETALLEDELRRKGVDAEFLRAASAEEFLETLETGAFDAVAVNDALLHRTSIAQVGAAASDRLAHQHAAMSRLIAVVQELSLAREFQQIVDIVRRAARDLTGADCAAFVLRDGDQAQYVDGDTLSAYKGQRTSLRACVSGWAMLEQRALAVEDISTEQRLPVQRYRETSVKSLVVVPIRSSDPLGAISVGWNKPHQCTADELMLLEALANTTAVSIENVRIYADLERRVDERTRALQALNEELEAFTSAVSHDLRTPLRAMSASVELLGDAGQAQIAVQQERLRTLVVSMNTLIDDLLRLSRVSRAQLKIERCDLGAMAASILQRMQQAWPERSVKTHIGPDMMVDADSGLMMIALENILSNAWKYTCRRDTAEIYFTSQMQNGRRVYTVGDNGVGFDPRERRRIFAPFERLHAERHFAGTGLGLATVQRVITRHGGSVWADGAIGAGARFSFTLC